MRRVTEHTGKVSTPLGSLNRGHGWVSTEPTEPGILIKLSPSEHDGVFITDAMLNDLGYYFRRPRKKREMTKEGDEPTNAKEKTKKHR